MSSIDKYESLKTDGSWTDRIKYVLSLANKTEIEQHLKQSSQTSYDDLQMWVFLSASTKNAKNLLDIFRNETLPAKQRAHAGKAWTLLQKDDKQVHDFLVQSINDKRIPRFMKHQLLKNLHQVSALKKSPTFFFDLLCRLTESHHHDQYNLDAHLLPFCRQEQALDLLSRWSITRLDQLAKSSPLYLKLVRYQPAVMLELVKKDLNEKKTTDKEKFVSYFENNAQLLESLTAGQAKAIVALTVDYVKQMDAHQRFLPALIQSKLKYFFRVAPDEMIQLLAVVGAHQPGSIKYQSTWSTEGYDLSAFPFPCSFTSENYVRLFMTLYEICQWSANHTICALGVMLSKKNSPMSLGALKKQRKWLVDTVINQRIGKEAFMKKLLKEGDEGTLDFLEEYPEFTTPLSLHLITQAERKGVVDAKQRLSLLRYQTLTDEVFDEFLSLFKKTGSDVNQRIVNYPLFFQCALSTGEQSVRKVLQWIEKRFANEQLMVVETFINKLQSSDDRFQLENLPKNFESVQAILDIALNHLQRSSETLCTIIRYGILLLERAEHDSNTERKAKLQAFATQLIKQCYSKNESVSVSSSSAISRFYPQARQIYADILVTDVLPTLVSKCMLNELTNALNYPIEDCWRLPQIDAFVNKFFTESLPSSTKLQSAFRIDSCDTLISLFLKTRATRFERVDYLLNKLDQVFFINDDIQRSAVRSEQHRSLLDQLVDDETCVTLDKLAGNNDTDSKFFANSISSRMSMKLPGLSIELLDSCSHLLTGKQQQHITNIILNDYLQNQEVSNLDKLKSLRVLRRFTHTYDQTLQWFKEKQGSPLALKNAKESSSGRTRGAAAQPLDDIIICLPATFDLTPVRLLEHFDLVKSKLNASNAKFISDAMLTISRRIPDEIFLKQYVAFVQDEEFSKLGITANKEVLRLLIQYVSDPSLVAAVIQPLWNRRPHQDVRACLILTLFHFVGKTSSADEQTAIWDILRDAANDEYLPVIQSFFAAHRGESRWPLTYLKATSKETFKAFVNQLQFQILDHPTSLEARSWAWSHIDHEHVDAGKLTDKAAQICVQFDKEGNTLWQNAFQTVLSSYKHQNLSSLDRVIDIMTKIMARRDEIDSRDNAVDKHHDLPVYHRVHRLLTVLSVHMGKLDHQKRVSTRSITPIVLKFDKTLAPLLGTLLIKTAQSKEELEDIFSTLQGNLPDKYFERVISHLSSAISGRDAFLQQLNVDDKLEVARWFVEEKKRAPVVFNLLKDSVFNEAGVNREKCQDLLRQMRESEDLYLRQQAMEYTVPWKEDGDDTVEMDDADDRSDSAMS